jgi:hypothetical protein
MKKVSLIFLIFTLIFVLQSSVFAQTFEWARKGASNVFATGSAMTIDGQGNSYVTGTFLGKITFGEIELNSQGGRDIYLVKYDKEGQVIWAQRAGGQADDFANSVALDKDGNCYIAGAFAGKMIFAGDTISAKGQHDILIAKFSSKGQPLWCKSGGGYYEDHAMTISLDKFGNSYVAGFFKDTLWFGSGKMLVGKGMATYNMFLAKFDSKGNVVWAKPIAGSNYTSPNEGHAMASDVGGMTTIASYYQGDAVFDGTTLSSKGAYAFFIARYNADGKMLWVRSSNGDRSSVVGKALAVDKKGNCYATGTFTMTTAFDTTTLTSRNLGYPDMFLAKYNSSGELQWVRQTSGFGSKSPFDAAVDAEGNPYVFGTFRDTAIFGKISLSGIGTENIFLIKYNQSGEPQWAKQVGREGILFGKAMRIDKDGDVFMTGNFTDTAEFGKARIEAKQNTQDMFFAMLSPRVLVKETKLPDSAAPDFSLISCKYDPHSHTAIVRYSIPRSRFVRLELTDIMGEVDESFIEGQREAGVYDVKLDLKDLKDAGDDYCRLQADKDKQTKKMSVAK